MYEQLRHCQTRCKVTGQQVLVTFAYGLHSIVQRCPLLDSLMELGGSIADPWIILGDFNALLSVYDKVGGLPVTNYELQDFESLVHSCNLVDL